MENSSEPNEYDNAGDVAALKAANNAWAKAIDIVVHAVKAYNTTRANFRDTVDEVMPRRIQEQKIALQEKAKGKPDRMEQWRQAERELLEIGASFVPEIDAINNMKWTFRY